ncbi:MAG: pilus assembly protein [Clostridiaceae bacterium]|jgi:hypothetical protein|nr:pilus assembly protein [Clostridiaceae bacterium]
MYGSKSEKGSTTIEAALIFPVIFLTIVSLVYVSVFLYEKAYIKSIANRAVERGAAIWKNPETDMYISLVKPGDFKNNDPYWRLIDLNKTAKEEKVENYIKKHLDEYSILRSRDKKGPMNTTDIEFSAELKNYLVYKKLIVTVDKKFELPLGNGLAFLGINNTVKISAKSEAIVNEPAEFIRSTDLAIDMGKRIDALTGNHLEKTMDKVNKFIDDIKGKVTSALE